MSSIVDSVIDKYTKEKPVAKEKKIAPIDNEREYDNIVDSVIDKYTSNDSQVDEIERVRDIINNPKFKKRTLGENVERGFKAAGRGTKRFIKETARLLHGLAHHPSSTLTIAPPIPQQEVWRHSEPAGSKLLDELLDPHLQVENERPWEKWTERGINLLEHLLLGRGVGISEGVGSTLRGLAGTTGRAAAGATAGQVLEEIGAPEILQGLGEVLVSGGIPRFGKNIPPKNAYQERQLKFLREKELTKKQMAPVIAEQNINRKFANLVDKEHAKKKLKETGDALGAVRKSIVEEGRDRYIPEPFAQHFARNIRKKLDDLNNSSARLVRADTNKLLRKTKPTRISSEKPYNRYNRETKKMERVVPKTHKPAEGMTEKDVMEWYKKVNEEIYSKLGKELTADARKNLHVLKDDAYKVLQQSNPALATEFKMYNEAYSHYAKIRARVNPQLFDHYIPKGKFTALVKGFMTDTAWPTIKTLTAISGAQRAMTLMITSPRLQNLSTQLALSLKKNKAIAAQRIYNQMEKILQEEIGNEE